MFLRLAQKRAATPSAWPLSTALRLSVANGSRGGFGTKIDLKTDGKGQPLGFELTGGEASNSTQFEALMKTGSDTKARAYMGDKGYDSEANRQLARAVGQRQSMSFEASCPMFVDIPIKILLE